MRFVIGVEGGGTKTNVALADENGKIITKSVSGPSNFLIVGFDKASENIIEGIEKCLSETGISKTDLTSIMLGLTGAGRLFDQNNMKNAFTDYSQKCGFKFNHVVVNSDARISLEAAFPNKPGMIMIAGTGSIMFGKNSEGEIFRVGGWGRILGDEGSGLFIGKKGLIAVIRQIDGRGDKTIISDIISEKYNLNSLETIIKAVYTDNFDIASLAPSVYDAANRGDRIAVGILDEAVSELLLHVKTMVKKIKFEGKLGLAFVGSIITNDNYTRKRLVDEINKNISAVELIDSESDPLEGAVIMAINSLK